MEEAQIVANELKHTNEHLARHEQKIDTIESQPKMRLQADLYRLLSG